MLLAGANFVVFCLNFVKIMIFFKVTSVQQDHYSDKFVIYEHPGTSTVEFTGENFIMVDRKEEKHSEVQDTTLRFRTTSISGLLFLAKSQLSLDTLELSLNGARVRIYVRIGHYEKEMVVGQSLNDDLWHTITFRRRGNIFEGFIDDEEPKKGVLES